MPLSFRRIYTRAVVLPAAPGFYHRPAAIDDLVAFVVARVLDQLAVEHDLTRRWTSGARPPRS